MACLPQVTVGYRAGADGTGLAGAGGSSTANRLCYANAKLARAEEGPSRMGESHQGVNKPSDRQDR